MSLHIDFKHLIENFSAEERKAQDAAQHITTQMKNMLTSDGVIAIEKLTGTEALGEAGLDIVNKFSAALNSDVVKNAPALVNSLLGGLGAQITGLIAVGEPIIHGIGKFIHIFETLFQHKKQTA